MFEMSIPSLSILPVEEIEEINTLGSSLELTILLMLATTW